MTLLVITGACRVVAALIRGDPHFRTIDGLEYTFNGLGLYWLVQTIDGSTSIQVSSDSKKTMGREQGRPRIWSRGYPQRDRDFQL